MAAERWVVLGLATPRATWFRDLTRWAASAAVPVELVRCVSIEDLRARVASGRLWSAVLLDAGVSGTDVDLVASAGAPVLVVDDGRTGRDWRALGAAAVLPHDLTREALLDALAAHAATVATPSSIDGVGFVIREAIAALVAVVGAGGAGATTAAAALAHGLAARSDVVLADLALRADQAVLHDVRDVAPGVQELVEAHRSHRPRPDQVRALTFRDDDRGYHVLLGLRHERYWSTLRPKAVEASVQSLRSSFGFVVADVTADLDGSTSDLEERNALARAAVRSADLVLAVGRPTTKGMHALVRVLADLAVAGVEGDRVVPVVTTAPRHPRQRAELAALLADLARTTNGPLFLPTRRVDDAWRDARPIPEPLPSLLAGAVGQHLDRLGRAEPVADEPELVTPGALGLA